MAAAVMDPVLAPWRRAPRRSRLSARPASCALVPIRPEDEAEWGRAEVERDWAPENSGLAQAGWDRGLAVPASDLDAMEWAVGDTVLAPVMAAADSGLVET